MQKKVKQLQQTDEFQPDAIMLEQQNPPFPLHIVWFVILVLLIAAVIWACFAKVDKIVVADGKVVTVNPTLTMKQLERSVIKKVHVRVGQKVKQGDVLFTFDPTTNQQELDLLNEQLQSYKATSERIRAELDGKYVKDFSFSGTPNDDQLLQLKQYNSRKDYFLAKIRAYDESISCYKKTAVTYESALARYKERSSKLSQIEQMMNDLEKNQAVSMKDLLQTQVTAIETEISVDQMRVSLEETRTQIVSAEAEKTAFIREWERQLVEELVTNDRNINSLEKEIPKYKMLVDNTELRAPCNAVVHEIAPFQQGSAVQEAEMLISLIPIDVEFEAEVDIPAKDISWVKVGDECRLKFDAFPFQQCGTLTGYIFYISQDAFNRKPQQDISTDDGGQLSQEARSTTYQARMTIYGKFTGRAKNAELLPGMRLRAEIRVGNRTVMNYILNPFVKAMDEAIREP